MLSLVCQKMYRHLLVPVDSTDVSVDLVANAVNFAASARARVTFVHTGACDHSAEVHDAPATGRGFFDDGRCAAAETLAQAEAAARAWGVPSDSMNLAGQAPVQAILEAATGQACDIIFVASQGPRCASGLQPSWQAAELLARSHLPVLIAATSGWEHWRLAITAMRDDHRLLVEMLHAWVQALDAAQSVDSAPPASLMRSTVEFVQRLVGMNQYKSQQLFSRLRARTSFAGADLDELERQHQRELALLSELAELVDALELSRAVEQQRNVCRALEAAVSDYVRFIRNHVGREEGVILPAARRYFEEADWSILEHAFAESSAVEVERASRPDHRSLHACILDYALLASVPAFQQKELM